MSENIYRQPFEEEYSKLIKEYPWPNILVAGPMGAGKSTLINLVMRKPVAMVGQGTSTTQEFEVHKSTQYVIYDSRGYETGEKDNKRFFYEINEFLEEQEKNPKTAINIIWYCISAASARITDIDKMVKSVFDNFDIPTALIFTQIDTVDEPQLKELKEAAKNTFGSIPIFLSSDHKEAQEYIENSGLSGLEELYKWSLSNMEKTRKRAFWAACNRDLDTKRAEGIKIATQHAAGAFGIGFTPIPFADAPFLIAAQMGMVARLSYLWGLDLKKQLMAHGALEVALTTLGRNVAVNVIKLFPGVGTLIGGMINGTVGAALTFGLGCGINEICYNIAQKEAAGADINLADYFTADILMSLINKYKDQYKK